MYFDSECVYDVGTLADSGLEESVVMSVPSEKAECFVTHVVSPMQFWIHTLLARGRFDAITETLTEKYNNTEYQEDLELTKGTIVAAK